MADRVRVFVSHHHSPDEDAFTDRLVADLEAVGADVWVDNQRITSDDFVKKINEGLTGRQWLVLVMTPEALRSEWVQAEVNAALNQVRGGRMQGAIPVVATPCDEAAIPPLWAPLHRYDATRGYDSARDGLLHALGLAMLSQPALKAAPPAIPSTPVQYPPSTFPPPAVPARLATLGYRGFNITGAPAYLPPLITIPAGRFLMGSDPSRDIHADKDETPMHWVYVDEFAIAQYPVTLAEYDLAVRSGFCKAPPGHYWELDVQEAPDRPVSDINWDDAQQYIIWLVSVTNLRGWRLPTEAEWEKAARWDPQASVSRRYPWGDAFDKRRCNSQERNKPGNTAVGAFRAAFMRPSGASAYGVEDMAGDVSEWTSSLYAPYPYRGDDGRESMQAARVEWRVLRGGSWLDDADEVRAAKRTRTYPSRRESYYGFRLVLASGAGA